MIIGFNWQGHEFEAEMDWDGDQWFIDKLHMIVGEQKVSMEKFLAEFDDLNEHFQSLAADVADDQGEWEMVQ